MSAAVVPRTTFPPVAAGPHRRIGWLALALLALGSAVVVGVAWSEVWAVVVFAIAPDLSFVAGFGQRAARGQLARRAVPIYNLVHRPLVPMALAAAGVLGLLPPWCVVAGLAWLGHIGVDRTVGFGLRTEDGWQRA